MRSTRYCTMQYSLSASYTTGNNQLPLDRLVEFRKEVEESRMGMQCRDRGVLVDEQMRTSAPAVFAAGDACCAATLEQASAQWFQMRLWTQVSIRSTHTLPCCIRLRLLNSRQQMYCIVGAGGYSPAFPLHVLTLTVFCTTFWGRVARLPPPHRITPTFVV